ncbi:MAG: putative molybdenum carrier protein [Candidatus Hydrogenedentes bacterium]|nr:putative molybdenum carrier protein [Candidatus Hydrogenedentota bacterium]
MIERVISGGQTGVDRAALDVALRLDIPCGGWCPHGRFAEDGRIPAIYPLNETPNREYAQRTLWNVRDADATLVLATAAPEGGTAYTLACAKQMGKPFFTADLLQQPRVEPVVAWLKDNRVRVLNVAGPRESTSPGVHQLAADFLATLLAEVGRV